MHVWEAEEPFGAADKLDHSHGSVYSLASTKEYLILGNNNLIALSLPVIV